jgi:hypothetical protein
MDPKETVILLAEDNPFRPESGQVKPWRLSACPTTAPVSSAAA